MLAGEKVILRDIDECDTENIIKWRNSPEVLVNFFVQDILTKETHNAWLKNHVKTGHVTQFIIIDKKTNKPVGSTFLKDIDTYNKKAEFGIFIGEPTARGKGLGSEAAALISNYGLNKLNLNRIYLRVFAHNVNAIKSYEKAGFIREALLIQDVYANNQFNNVVMMAKLKNRELI
jgi:Acetyltransferases, including N-acetylases of ribosomal proteins